MSKFFEIQPVVITTFALSDLMALSEGYPNALIPLVAEPFHRIRNDRECHRVHFCCAKAGVSRRKSVMPLRLLPNHQGLLMMVILFLRQKKKRFSSKRATGRKIYSPVYDG